MITGQIVRQHLKLNDTHIVADTIDYLEAKFEFRTDDWDGLDKWAHFAKDSAVYDIRLTDNCIRKEDHLNLSAGMWKVYLHGNEFRDGEVVQRITTDEAVLYVIPTGTLDGEPFPTVPPSAGEQIIASAAAAEASAKAAAAEARQAADKAAQYEPEVFWAEYGVTAFADVAAAYDAGKLCGVRYLNLRFIAARTSSTTERFIEFTGTSYYKDHYMIRVTASDRWSISKEELLSRRLDVAENIEVDPDSSEVPTVKAVYEAILRYGGNVGNVLILVGGASLDSLRIEIVAPPAGVSVDAAYELIGRGLFDVLMQTHGDDGNDLTGIGLLRGMPVGDAVGAIGEFWSDGNVSLVNVTLDFLAMTAYAKTMYTSSGGGGVVTITQNADGAYTSSHTPAEIAEMAQTGAVVAAVSFANNDSLIFLSMIGVSYDIPMFSTTVFEDGDISMVTFFVGDDAVVAQWEGTRVAPMTGASAADGGKPGIVPAPSAGQQDAVLHGDGTWRKVESGGGATVEVDTTLTQSGKAADAKVTGEKFSEVSKAVAYLGGTTIEPAEEDIPKVFFSGDIAGMSKNNAKDLHISYRSKSESFDGVVEMKWQGSSSIRWDKKNFTIKMFSDSTKNAKLKKNFRGWGEQNKFCLKANFIDHSHARNVVSARLWDEVVSSRQDYNTLPAAMRNSPRNGAVDGFPIKVYINGTYEGIYTWNIPKDGWMFNMDEENSNHCVLCGANNSFNGRPTPTSCQFRIPYNSSDWKTEFPDVLSENMIASFNRVVTFITTASDADFKAHLDAYVNVQSAIDYRIFADVIAHHDGLGNNMIFMTYDGVIWLFSMYDMDSTFGLWWDGTRFVSVDLAFPAGFQEPDNLMWERLDKCFASEIKARYSELRANVLSLANIDTHFERFTDVIGSDLYNEDLSIYNSIPSGSTNNIKQIRNYIRDRLIHVDSEIDALGTETPEPDTPSATLTSISAIYSGGNVTVGTALTDMTGIVVTAHYSDSTTAIVTGYTLSGTIAEGSNTITVTYQGMTATFTVTGVVDSGNEPEEPNAPSTSTLIHLFDGSNATTLSWVDDVDSTYQFDFTGTPAVDNDIVSFSTSSYGVLNKALNTVDADTTLAIKVKIDNAKTETWAFGAPNWSNGFIIGKKGLVGIDTNEHKKPMGQRVAGVQQHNETGSNRNTLKLCDPDDNFHVFVAKYIKSESMTYWYCDGVLVGSFDQSVITNWLSCIINLNNEAWGYRGNNAFEYIKIWSGALTDVEIASLV